MSNPFFVTLQFTEQIPVRQSPYLPSWLILCFSRDTRIGDTIYQRNSNVMTKGGLKNSTYKLIT